MQILLLKLWKPIALISICFLLYWLIRHQGQLIERELNSIQESKIKDEAIEKNKAEQKREETFRSISTDNNVKWLRDNFCKDCNN